MYIIISPTPVNFDYANIFRRQLPGGPDSPDPQEIVLGFFVSTSG